MKSPWVVLYSALVTWITVATAVPAGAQDERFVDGGSDPDGEIPTPRHVAQSLHALLGELGADPPYVLVGHSLGGPFIRMFTALYPNEVAGLVYVDPSDWMSAAASREYDRAMGISEEGRRRLNEAAPATFGDLPTASVRAEAEMMYDMREEGWLELQDLPEMPNVPVSVLMSARFDPQPADAARRDCEPRECHDRRIAFRRSWLAGVADEVSVGTLTVVNHSGHFIQNEDPDLVAWAIRRVLEAEVPKVGLQLSEALLTSLVGVYENASRARLSVVLEDGQLFSSVVCQAGSRDSRIPGRSVALKPTRRFAGVETDVYS